MNLQHLPQSVSVVCGEVRVTYRPNKGFTVHGRYENGSWFKVAWFFDLACLRRFSPELADAAKPKVMDLNVRRADALEQMRIEASH